MKKEEQCKKILEFLCKELNTICEGKITITDYAYNGKFALAENPCHIVFISGTNCFNVFKPEGVLLNCSLCASSCTKYFTTLKRVYKHQKLVSACQLGRYSQLNISDCFAKFFKTSFEELVVLSDIM